MGSHASSSRAKQSSFPIVGIGASAGGLEAFTQLISQLPRDTGMAFVLVQHLDPHAESSLTQILARVAPIPVREAQHNQVVEADTIYVIPAHSSLRIAARTLKLAPRTRSRSPSRAIDDFFESLAQDLSDRSIGVILSGTASDGTLGLEAIKAEGGITYAQDGSAKYESMPRSAIAAGCVDFVGSPAEIAAELARVAKHPSIASHARTDPSPEETRAFATQHAHDRTALPSGGAGSPRIGAGQARAEGRGAAATPQEKEFKTIMALLREHSGVDFSLYKSATIERRIVRRMVLNKQNTPDEYAVFLKDNSRELDALYSDVLISVTNFFRDPASFEVLKRKVFQKVKRRRDEPPFRIWVLGCSTGQEAYSLAMSFLEAAGDSGETSLQVFATDLNEALLEKARQGLYAKSLVHDISPERLKRFFVEEQGGYRVVKSLRERVVFARQNVMSDPPFSRMDLISCRNLLIYLEPSLQRRAFPAFHYALNQKGTLFLGASESVGGFTDLFEPLDKKHKLFAKKAAANRLFRMPTKMSQYRAEVPSRENGFALSFGTKPNPWVGDGGRSELAAQREADRVTINQYAPPGVLVDSDLRILQFRGATSAFLEPPTGKASFDLLKMARENLMLPLRAATAKAKQTNKVVRSDSVCLRDGGAARSIRIVVTPLQNLRDRCFLVLFTPEAAPGSTDSDKRSKESTKAKRSLAREQYSDRVLALETELAETRDYLQSVQEQHEVVNSELQASGEEAQSANEELQSVNEELETSKEELESSNEELITINEELTNRNVELGRANSDLVNLQASTNLSIVLLGRDLSIRRFSVQAEKQFRLLSTDIGRSIGSMRHDLTLRDPSAPMVLTARYVAPAPIDLEQLVSEVIASAQERHYEAQDRDGRWYSVRVRPYVTLDNQIDGAVLVLVDIDALKRSERAISAARNYAESILRTARDPLVVLRHDLRIDTANDAFYKTFGGTPAETEGQHLFAAVGGALDTPELRPRLEDIVSRNIAFNDVEIERQTDGSGVRRFSLNARPFSIADSNSTPMILLAIEDITERQRAHQATAELAAIIRTTEDAVLTKTLDGIITSWNRGAERMFGYRAEEIVGRNVALLSANNRRKVWPGLYETLQSAAGVADVDVEWQRKDGSAVSVSLSIAPLTDTSGELNGVSLIARDISERRRAQENTKLLADVGAELLKLTTIEQIVRVVGRQMAEHFNVGLCMLVEVDNAVRPSLGQIWQSDTTQNALAADRLAAVTATLKERRSSDQPFVIHDTSSSPDERCRRLQESGIGAVLAIPLSFDQRRRYFLGVCHSAPRFWRESEIDLLCDLGMRVCMRLERLRAEDTLRMSEERYFMLFESIDEGFCVLEKAVTPDGAPIDFRYVEVNPAFEVQSGLTDVVGRSMRQIIPDEHEEWYSIFDQVLATGESIRMQREFKSKGRVLDLYAFRVEDATKRRLAVIFKDITERFRLERTAQSQADALADLDRRKDEFLAMLSHELRNPLAPIANAVRLLMQLPVDNPLHKRACTIIERQVSQLTHLVEDLMEVSRITTGRVQLRMSRTAMGDIVERAVDTLRPTIEQQKHELTVSIPDAPIWLEADSARIEQVVVNLLGNAAKYTDRGGHLWLTLEQEGAECVLKVRDDGIGIPPELLPHIFDLFTQGERSLDRSRGGLGIGLALVRRLVELHHGRVEVASLKKGTEFTVRLPVAAPPAILSSTAAQEIRPLERPLRVLIVDDNLDEVDSLSMLVKEMGHAVATAADGEHALAAAAQFHPDVMLLDIGLPGVSGYEVAQTLRQRINGSLTLVAVTGYGQQSDRRRCIESGFDHHLVKPADFAALRSILNMTAGKLSKTQ